MALTWDEIESGPTAPKPDTQQPGGASRSNASQLMAEAERWKILRAEYRNATDPADKAALSREIGRMTGTRLPLLPGDAGDTSKPSEQPSTALTWDSIESGTNPQKKPMSRAEISAGGLKGVKKVGGDVAALTDMILSAPAFTMSIGVNLGARVKGLMQGRNHRDISSVAKYAQEEFMKDAEAYWFANPVKRALGLFNNDDIIDDSHVAHAMGFLQQYVDRGGEAVEHMTKGTVNKDDTQVIFDMLTTFAGGKIGDSTVAGSKKFAEFLRKRKPIPDADMKSGKPSAETVKEVVDEYFKTPEAESAPVDYKRGAKVVEGYIKADKDIAAFDIAHGLIQRGADINEVRRTIKKYKHLPIEKTMDEIMQRRREVMEGASGDMIMQPDTQRTPRRASPAAVDEISGGVDTRPALGTSPRPPQRQLGGVDRGAIDQLENVVPKAAMSLGALLAGRENTLKTLERLPPNRAEFSKEQIRQNLNRPDVPAAEKAMLESAMEAIYGDKVTAKQLMRAVDAEMKDYKLSPSDTKEYAGYGLDRINREPYDFDNFTPEELDLDPNNLPPDLKAATTVWQLPEHMPMSAANHFKDERYFGHTRKFTEDGTRHVVEIQSDLMQKAKGGVTDPAEFQRLLDNEAHLNRGIGILNGGGQIVNTFDKYVKWAEDAGIGIDVKLRMGEPLESYLLPDSSLYSEGYFQPDRAFDKALEMLRSPETPSAVKQDLERVLGRVIDSEWEGLNAAISESQVKREATAINSQLAPMKKNWDRRLIREELADAARNGEKVVRFADADTVAKVEGWPERNAAYGNDVNTLRDNIEYFQRNPHLPAADTVEPMRQRLADLESGTRAFSKEHQGIYDRYNKETAKFLMSLGGKKVVDANGHGWIEVPVTPKEFGGGRAQMFGRVDQDLLNKGAAIGLTAAAAAFLSSDDNKVRNAVLFPAILGLGMYAASKSPAVAETAKSAGRAVDDFAGLVSTRMQAISPKMWLRAVDHERRTLTATHEVLKKLTPFVEGIRKLPEEQRNALDVALKNPDHVKVEKMLADSGNPELLTAWKDVRAFLRGSGVELKRLGIIDGQIPDYYPRMVSDLDGLLKAVGSEKKAVLEKMIQEAESKSIKRTGEGLTVQERSKIVNDFMLRGSRVGKPGFAKSRSIDEVTPELAKYYAPSSDALVMYAQQAVKSIERAKFFGKDLKLDPETGRVNLDASIGEVIESEIRAGKITADQVEDLRGLLHARFGPGEMSPITAIRTFQNITNAGLLGNIASATVQAGDVAMSAYAYGILPAVKAVKQIAVGKKAVNVRDLGLIDHMAQELVPAASKPMTIAGREVSSAKFLEKVFKYSGFSAIDQFGKNTLINAAFEKSTKSVNTPAGIESLKQKYGPAFGEDFGKLVEGLKAKELTPEVRLYLFAELSRFQPISKLEVPKKYLEAPNGRVMYMLKTYMLKQMDVVRRDIIQEFKRGNATKATKDLLRLGVALGAAGATTEAVRNWMLGKDDALEASDVPLNFLKTFGWSKYTIDQFRKGQGAQAVAGMASPPLSMWEQIATGDEKALRYVPLIGPLLYGHSKNATKKEADFERQGE